MDNPYKDGYNAQHVPNIFDFLDHWVSPITKVSSDTFWKYYFMQLLLQYVENLFTAL